MKYLIFKISKGSFISTPLIWYKYHMRGVFYVYERYTHGRLINEIFYGIPKNFE